MSKWAPRCAGACTGRRASWLRPNRPSGRAPLSHPSRDRAEWPDLFGEALLASAALDRLTQGADFVEITGASFRAEHTKKQTATRRSRATN